MAKIPYVDLSCCNLCEACIEICPQVFAINPETELLVIQSLDHYPEELVEEAMAFCPGDCISWEE